MRYTTIFIALASIAGCTGEKTENAAQEKSVVIENSATERIGAEPVSDTVAEKGNAALKGLEDAKRDVELLRKRLPAMSNTDLVVAFVPRPMKNSFGGYNYFYGFMSNRAVVDEIESRDQEILDALKSQRNNETRVAEAINGRGLTIGRICEEELYRRSSIEMDR